MPGQLVIETVTPGLCTQALGRDPARGVPVAITTYRGDLQVRQVTTGATTLDPDLIHVAAFLVPDAPVPAAPYAVAAEVFLRFYRTRGGGTQAQGVRNVDTDVAADRLRVTFEMPRSTEYAELGYQVVVVTDAEASAL